MVRHFFALTAQGNRGKTTLLNKLITDKGTFLFRKTKGVFRIPTDAPRTVVFVETSSPQERAHGKMLKAIEILEKDVLGFEKLANVLGVSDFYILIAFTITKRNADGRCTPLLNSAAIQGYEKHVVELVRNNQKRL